MHRRPVSAAALLAVAVALTGCAPTPGAAPTASPTPAPSSPASFFGPHLVERNGRYLLVSDGFDGDQTSFAGRLGVNAEHCVTAGRFVLIAPKGSRLLADGSVEIGSTTFRQGAPARVSGSRYLGPVSAACGSTGYWAANMWF